MQEFDLKTLAQFDGTQGKPVYIVFKGKVFDVSNSRLWKGGMHQKRHHAGEDLTDDLEQAPHGEEVFKRYPQVGTLK